MQKRGISRQLVTSQLWDTETPGRLLLPSRSGPCSWNTRAQRAVFWIRTLVITKEPADREGGFKGGNREMGRAKRRARKGRVPALPPEPPSQIAGRLSSSCPPSQLLSSCSGFTAAEKDSSDGSDWEISVCSQNRVAFSRDCLWIHITSALPSLSLRLLPNDFVSPHPTFFLSFQTSSVHLGLLLSLRSLWTSLQVYF